MEHLDDGAHQQAPGRDREPSGAFAPDASALEGIRGEIDLLDARIVEALGRRFQLCRDIARLKKERLLPVVQPGRAEAVQRHCADLCARHHVSPALVHEMYRMIMDESCRVQNEVISGAETPSRNGRGELDPSLPPAPTALRLA